jgi:hypothetical protein
MLIRLQTASFVQSPSPRRSGEQPRTEDRRVLAGGGVPGSLAGPDAGKLAHLRLAGFTDLAAARRYCGVELANTLALLSPAART